MGILAGGVRFDAPWALALAAAFAALFLVSVARERRPAPGVLFSSLGLLPPAGASLRVRLRWTLLVLRLAAAAFAVAALARPQVATASVDVPTEGIDIVVVQDVSSSMDTRDFGTRSRIAGAKSVIHDFVGGLRTDRVGVVLFSSEAMILSPLTVDYSAVQGVVEPIGAGTMLRDGTAIGTGIATGLNVLRESAAKSKVMILLTDGENNSGQITPLDGAEMARLLGIRVYTIGVVGKANEVDERLMRRISAATGGQYYSAADEGTLRDVYLEIQQLERSRVGTRRQTGHADAYLLFLAPAALLLALEIVLAATAFRRAP